MESELKAIRHRIGNSLFKIGRQSGKTQLAKDLNYLIEQAEKKQELKKKNEQYRKLLVDIDNECEMMLYYKFYKNDDGLTYRRIRKWIEDGQSW